MSDLRRGAFRGRISALVASLGVALTLTSFLATDAEARRYRRHHVRHHYHRTAYTPAYAAMVVDANTGRTLHADHENDLRHPASITKVMTLYMLFEQLERGKLSLDSRISISAHAASQSPSKLGLRPGSSIEVESAIKAVVTKSANDIAVAIAEAVGGDEDTFAELMTKKAHALGMSRTVYRNASGLPNSEQVTTARDLTVLGRSIQERFPRYYRYFSTHTFNYAGSSMRNHNHLLGRVEGMDGIKTGYTRASGFNLLTSVRRDGRHIVSVVLGGRSGAVRDRIMANLIENNMDAGARGRTAVAIADTSAGSADNARPVGGVAAAAPAPAPVVVERLRVEPAKPAKTETVAYAPMQVTPAAQTNAMAQNVIAIERPRPAVVTGSAVPMQPTAAQAGPVPRPAGLLAAVRQTNEEGAAASTASLGDTKRIIGATGPVPRPVAASIAPATPSPLRWVQGAQSAPSAKLQPPSPIAAAKSADAPVAESKIAKAPAKTETAKAETAKAETSKAETASNRPAAAKSGWMIQIGATDDAGKASDLLTRAKARSHSNLASAMPFTEKVQKGEATLYRARFAGLDTASAEAACRDLKKSGFACFATKN